MAGTSNYGSTWTFANASYKCIVTGFPEITTDELDSTNHSSGGYAESVPSGLVRVGDITMSVLEESGNFSTFQTAMVNKTIATSVIENNLTTLTGSSFIVSVKMEDADAQSPDVNKLTVVLAATGVWVASQQKAQTMTKVLSKADLLEGKTLQVELVEIPDIGASVWMRQMSAQESIDFRNFLEQMKAEGVKETTPEQDIEIMLFIVSMSLCDEEGNSLFTREEAKKLVKNYGLNTLVYMTNEALRVSKIKIGNGGFVSEATNTLPNDQSTSSLENSQGSQEKPAPKFQQ